MLALVTVFALGCRPKTTTSPPPTTSKNEPEQDENDVSEKDGPAVVFKDARVMTATGVTYDRADVVVVGRRIRAVGPDLDVPPEARVIDAKGKTITPGIIDTHSHLGVYPSPGFSAHSDGNEIVGPNTAYVRAIDGYWPQDPQIDRARAGGVTTMQILPGSANLIGGRSVTVKLYPGIRSAEDARFDGAPDGLKMACGENPKRVYGEKGGPYTRMGNIAGFREAFQRASEYRRSLQRYQEAQRKFEQKSQSGDAENDDGDEEGPKMPPEPPARDFALETLVGVLDGEILVHNHCYRADEMSIMLELADEFGFSIRSFHHAVEAYKIADRLAKHGTSASVWADWWGFKAEAYDGIRANAALLDVAGARAIIHSDSPIGIQHLNQEAAKAMHAGRRAGLDVTEEDALEWITKNPAWALGIDDEVGTLEPGKQADLVVWNGNPFSVYTKAEQVFIEGRLTYDRNDPAHQPRSDFELGQPALAQPPQPSQASSKDAPTSAPKPSRLDFDTRATPHVLLTNAEIHVGNGQVIQGGSLEIRGARIVAVGGPELASSVGGDVERIDLQGKRVTPGLIAASSSVGLTEIDMEGSTTDTGRFNDDLVRAAYDASLATQADSTLLAVQAVDGVTTAAVTPSGGLFSGRVAWIDLLSGAHDELVSKPRVAMAASLGQTYAESRAATLAKFQEVLDDAGLYGRRKTQFDRREVRDLVGHRLDLEALAPVLDGSMPLLVHADRVSDMLALVDLAKQRNLDVVIVGGAQAWRIADVLAQARIPVLVQPSSNLPGGMDTLGARLDGAAILQRAGVPVGIATIGDAHNLRNLTQEAGLAVSYGLDPAAALEAVTLQVARIYGMDGDYGSLEAGKVANVVVWNGDPFELGTLPERVWIRGQAIPLENRQRALRDRYKDLSRFR